MSLQKGKSITDMIAELKALMTPFGGKTVSQMVEETTKLMNPYGGVSISDIISGKQGLSPVSAVIKPAQEDTGMLLVRGSSRDDYLTGSSKNEKVWAGAGHDKVDGGLGNDALDGEAGNDLLLGGGGRDTLNGGNGCDTLDGGSGLDVLIGGADADVFVFGRSWGNDRVLDFKIDVDRLDFRTSGVCSLSDLNVTYSNSGALLQYGTDSVLLAGVKAGTLDANDFIFG